MTDTQQSAAAKDFVKYWTGKGYEKGESQSFWISLLRDVYGIDHPEQYIQFEEQVHLDHTSFIDAYIAETKVLIEQKGLGKNLNKPIKQSDGSLLTPFEQAKRYITELPLSKHPRWVITCNFEKFFVYDMEKPGGAPEQILLSNLEKEYYRLNLLVNTTDTHLQREMDLSIQAGDIVGLLYDALLKQYVDPSNEKTLKSLNKLCVRLVFCLFAEDAGIFGTYGKIYRTGGDEFVASLFLNDDQLNRAEEEFTARLEAWSRMHNRELSLSWGCAGFRENPQLTLDELAKLAEHRMYEAKANYYKSKGIDRRR